MEIQNDNLRLSNAQIKKLQTAVKSSVNVSGLTHNFYRYPARFSPQFAKSVIEIFSDPGDIVLDPFVGGGTAAVEAFALKRNFIGIDVSPIATFVSNVKTTLVSKVELGNVKQWINETSKIRAFGTKNTDLRFWEEEGYFKNIPWQLKRAISIYIEHLDLLVTQIEKNTAKSILLKTSQWALDCKEILPTTDQFRDKLMKNYQYFVKGIQDLNTCRNEESNWVRIINGNSENLLTFPELKDIPNKPKLVITSPPYVGVQILYHQWQVNSRKRTRAPFWIVDSLDGHGSGHYTFGHYLTHGKKIYFENAKVVFSELSKVVHKDCIIVQLLGFSDHKKFLPLYLEAMEEAGLEEVVIKRTVLGKISRIWRSVPNRKWYTKSKENILSSKEVLLIHKLKS